MLNLSAPQDIYLNGLNNKFNAYVGGFGSGKINDQGIPQHHSYCGFAIDEKGTTLEGFCNQRQFRLSLA